MKATFNGCSFEDNGVGLVVIGDIEMAATDTHFRRNDKAVVLYNPALMQAVGLPVNTPADLLDEVVQALTHAKAATGEEKVAIAEKSRLKEWLASAGHLTTSAKNIVEIVAKVMQMAGLS
ncbi:hypothetical protein [Pseudomonas sp. Sample_14]|uniref:hypothetical protein n=1 Tax=Pseudomonas sp. Sample_14 TaxID=2448262 RepID=UPI001032BBA6|nr:hypothetical protein [Pseudomonas sp. Sample_14]